MDNDNFYDRVGKKLGWDFTHLDTVIEGEDLKFLLKNTPIIEGFGGERGEKILEEFIEKNRDKKGIPTSSCRVIIRGRKYLSFLPMEGVGF